MALAWLETFDCCCIDVRVVLSDLLDREVVLIASREKEDSAQFGIDEETALLVFWKLMTDVTVQVENESAAFELEMVIIEEYEYNHMQLFVLLLQVQLN